MSTRETSTFHEASRRLSENDWSKYFSNENYAAGREDCRKGLAHELNVGFAAGKKRFEVMGKYGDQKALRVMVSFQRKGYLAIRGSCQCKTGARGSHCRHMAALLAKLQNQGEGEPQVLAGKTQRQAREEPLKLSPTIREWTNRIQDKLWNNQGHSDAPEHYTALRGKQKALIYVLKNPGEYDSQRGTLLKLEVCWVSRKNGGYSDPQRVGLKGILVDRIPEYINGKEAARLRRMFAMTDRQKREATGFLFSPQDRDWHDLISEMLSDKVLTIGEGAPVVLQCAEPKEIEAFWLPTIDGKMATGLRFAGADQAAEIIPTVPAFYISRAAGVYGEAKINLPPGLSASDWMEAPVFEAMEIPLVKQALNIPVSRQSKAPLKTTEPPVRDKNGKAASPTDKTSGLPELPTFDEVVIDGTKIEPSGVLTLKRIDLQFEAYHDPRYPFLNFRYFGSNDDYDFSHFPVAEIKVKYGDFVVENPMSNDVNVTAFADGKLTRLKRDLAKEMSLVTHLVDVGLIPVSSFPDARHYRYRPIENLFSLARVEAAQTPAKWMKLVMEDIMEKTPLKLEVVFDDSFYFKMAESSGWYGELSTEGSGVDWMYFDYGLEVNGQRYSLVNILANLLHNPLVKPSEFLKAGEDEVYPFFLPECNLVVPVPTRRLGEIYQAVMELFDHESGKVKVHQLRAAQMLRGLSLDDFDESETVRKLEELGEKISNFEGVKKVAPPRSFKAQLRPYQQEGLNWLQFLRETKLNGILADDMGLGKTIQTLATIQTEVSAKRQSAPTLIIAPTSVVSNWVSEAKKFTPRLKVLLLQGLDRKQHFPSIREHDIVVTSYALLNRDIDEHRKYEYHYVILDEAQLIKNPKSQMAQFACELRSQHRLCLTGTPMENHLGELWSLVHFLMPGFLGTYERFRKSWKTPIEIHNDTFRRDCLVQKISPILLRRTKDLVLKELPPRTDIIQEVILEKAQSDLYESIRAAMDQRVRAALQDKGLAKSHIIVLDALLKLRQTCCDPSLLKVASAKRVKKSAKLEAFEELVVNQVESGRRILVFSQFTSMIEILERSLTRLKIGFVTLTGSTRKRDEVIDKFQNGKVPVFLISLKAGGSGLNLTAADTVIHYDPWWNPAVEEQATSRAHRMGQDKPVFVYRLVAKGTIEERILDLQQKKAELVRAVLAAGEGSGEEGAMKPLTQSDLERLLAPMN